MSSASAQAQASSPSDNLSLTARVTGVVRRPRQTFEALAAAPRSAAMLVVLFLVPFAASAALYSTDVGQQALVDRWERTAVAFGNPVDDARYAELQALSRYGVAYAAVTALTSGPAAAVALAAMLFGVFSGLRGGRASFQQVLAVVAHAGVVLVLREVIAAPLNYAREAISSPMSLGRLFPVFDEASPIARFLASIDLFVVWWLVVIAIGLGVIYGQRTRPIAALLIRMYVALALLLTAAMAILGGTV